MLTTSSAVLDDVNRQIFDTKRSRLSLLSSNSESGKSPINYSRPHVQGAGPKLGSFVRDARSGKLVRATKESFRSLNMTEQQMPNEYSFAD